MPLHTRVFRAQLEF